MKDYTLTKKEKKHFILYFDETEEKLIVHYASGKPKKKKNTEKNKRELLNKMEDQVKNAKDYHYQEEIEKEIDISVFWKRISQYCIIAVTICLIFSNFPFRLEHLLCTIGAVLGIINIIWNQLDIIQCKEKLKDLEKNEMYLEFDEIREEESTRILLDIYNEAKEKGTTEEKLKQIPLSMENLDEDININTVERMSYQEMRQMLENAKKLREIEFFSSTNHQSNIETAEHNVLGDEQETYRRQRIFKMYQLKEEQKNK